MVDDTPDILVKGSKFFADCKKRAGVCDRAFDLQAVADDSRIFKEAVDLGLAVPAHFVVIEIVEGFPEILPLPQNRHPAQTGLATLENKELKELAVIMQGRAPLLVVIAYDERVSGLPA